MSQTAYNRLMSKAFIGMKADTVYDLVEGQWIAQEAIPIGRAVVKTIGNDSGIELPDAVNQEFRGIAIHAFNLIQDSSTGLVQYAINDPVNVLVVGRAYVYSETAIDPDTDSVFIRTVAGGAGELVGQFRNDNAGGNAIAAPAFKFAETITAAGMILVKVSVQP